MRVANGVRWCVRIKSEIDAVARREAFAEVGISCRGPLITIRAGERRQGGDMGTARISIDAARLLRQALDEAIEQLEREAVP